MYPKLSELYSVMDWHENQTDHKPGESVGLFVTIPQELSQQFPQQGKELEDKSPAHITLLYLGSVPLQLQNKVYSVTQRYCDFVRPFSVKLGRPKKFVNDEEQIILHSPVKSKRLFNLHDILKQAFLQNQIPVDNKFPEYRPHITIAYCNSEDELNNYKHIKPQGSFEINHLWLWGGNQAEIIHLGKKR